MPSFRQWSFRELFAELPERVQAAAIKAFQIYLQNPKHPGLDLHFLDDTEHNPRSSFSVCVTKQYKAVGCRAEDGNVIWYWIGTHADYDRQFLRGRKH